MVTGSLAYDYLMLFPGHFKDHVLLDKTSRLSVSFLVDSMRRQRGGTAGNIAYSLGLLGESPAVLATAGQDFGEYRASLNRAGVDTSLIVELADDFTATCMINTDLTENQITAFYTGAMAHAPHYRLYTALRPDDLVIIAPNDPQAMVYHVEDCRALGVRYVYDPGMQTPRLDAEDLWNGIEGATVLIGNDYEFVMFATRLGISEEQLRSYAPVTVVTLGARGSQIYTASSPTTPIEVPVVAPRQVVNPTGAGDAYRAGLLTGLVRGWSLETAGRLGALVGSYAVEHAGPQEHAFTRAEVAARYIEHFGPAPEVLTWAGLATTIHDRHPQSKVERTPRIHEHEL